MENLVPAREAKGEIYVAIDGNENHAKLFKEDEVERAEKIAKALEGLPIESAQKLLEKMKKYLLQTLLT